VAGVYFPFSLEVGPKNNPQAGAKISIDRIEANVRLEESEFKMPAGTAGGSPQKQPHPTSGDSIPPGPFVDRPQRDQARLPQ
jgi:hypothetical protein